MDTGFKDALKIVATVALSVLTIGCAINIFLRVQNNFWAIAGIICILGGVGEAIAVPDREHKGAMVALSVVSVVVGVLAVTLFAGR